MVLSDAEIIERVARERMIEPFVDHQVGGDAVSYGLSSYGYDFRVAREFRLLSATDDAALDPKAFDARQLVEVLAEAFCLVPPNTIALARSVEYFRIPRDIVTVCLGKSTYARCGIVLNVTPFEPGWEGHATLAIANTTCRPVRVYTDEGIGQLLFLRAARLCRVSYKDRRGRYDRSTGIALPRVGAAER